MRICALLIGKHNSGSVPGKNYRSVLGRPLRAYPMMGAMDCHRIERLFVSTDSARHRPPSRACASGQSLQRNL
jgi:CMP-N-acetylneuraminic acid synthetase